MASEWERRLRTLQALAHGLQGCERAGEVLCAVLDAECALARHAVRGDHGGAPGQGARVRAALEMLQQRLEAAWA